MRILCWNMRGGINREEAIVDLLGQWQVTVALFLEPPQFMRSDTNDRVLNTRSSTSRGPTPSSWRLQGYIHGHSQGAVFVAYAANTAVTLLGGAQVPGTGQDNRLVFVKVVNSGETRIIATCHAPFAENSGEARQFDISAVKLLKNGCNGPLGGKIVEGLTTDIWLGDLNTYGDTAPPGAEPAYVIKSVGDTSGFGATGGSSHFPLDKIIVRSDVSVHRVGRVVPASVSASANDIRQSDWTNDTSVPSDHLPIYIDTSAVSSTPTLSVSTASKKRSLAEEFAEIEADAKKHKH